MWAEIEVSGKLKAGGKVSMPKYKLYFPKNADSDEFTEVDDKKEGQTQKLKFTPQLEASVKAQASLNLELTPQVNIGTKVGKEKGWLKDVVDAQIVGFMNNTLSFNINAGAEAYMNDASKGASAQFEVWISYFYNFGYGAQAKLRYLFNFRMEPRNIWGGKGKEIVLWKKENKVSTARRRLPAFLDDGPNSTLGLNEDWYSSYDDWHYRNQSSHLLRKRLDYSDIAAFGKGLLECNDGGQCQSGGCKETCFLDPDAKCAGGSCPAQRFIAPPPSDDEGDSDSKIKIQPAGTEHCISELPIFFYNCRYLPDMMIHGELKTGMCHNIWNGFQKRGEVDGPAKLRVQSTGPLSRRGRKAQENRNAMCVDQDSEENAYVYDGNTGERQKNKDGTDKRRIMSWQNKCSEESSAFWNRYLRPHRGPKGKGKSGNSNLVTCDEFPFNMLTEGGSPANVSTLL